MDWTTTDAGKTVSADGRWEIVRSSVNGWIVCRDKSQFITTKSRHYTVDDAKAHAESASK